MTAPAGPAPRPRASGPEQRMDPFLRTRLPGVAQAARGFAGADTEDEAAAMRGHPTLDKRI